MLELVLTRPDERQHLVARRAGSAVPGPRRAAHLPRPPGRRRRACSSAGCATPAQARRPAGASGTSATMASERHAGRADGRGRRGRDPPVRRRGHPRRVIGETLRAGHDRRAEPRRRCVRPRRPTAERRRRLRRTGRRSAGGWIETTFGLAIEQDTGRLIRRAAHDVPDGRRAPGRLRPAWTSSSCAQAIRAHAAGRVDGHRPGHRPPAVRVPAAPVPVQGRHRLRQPRARGRTAAHHRTVPDRGAGPARHALLPLGFCRECGQEYLVVARISSATEVDLPCPGATATPAAATRPTATSISSTDQPWPADPLAEGGCPTPGWSTTPSQTSVDALDRAKYLPRRGVSAARRHRLDGAGPGMRAGSCRRRSGSACAAGCPTSRSAATTSPSWPPWTPRAAPRRSPSCPAASIARLRGTDATDLDSARHASCSRSSTTARTPAAGRALQRLRAGHPAARRPVPGVGRRRPDGLTHDDVAAAGHRRAGAAMSRITPRTPDAKAHGPRAERRRCEAWSSTGCTPTCSAAGGSPCPTWSRSGLLHVDYVRPGEIAADDDTVGRPANPPWRMAEAGATPEAGPHPARRVPPGPCRRRRLPHRGRIRPGQAATPVSTCATRGALGELDTGSWPSAPRSRAPAARAAAAAT